MGLSTWLQRWKQAPRVSAYERGQGYVREQLASSEDRGLTLERLEAQASNPFDADDFERGMRAELFTSQVQPA